MSEIRTPRRYALLASHASERAGNVAVAMALRGKQQCEPAGAELAAAFPSRAQLVDAGYTTVTDLEGTDAAELALNAGLSKREAEAVLAALGGKDR